MKLSSIINYPLGWLGLKLSRKNGNQPSSTRDIENDREFMLLYEKVRPYSLVGLERTYALYQSVLYIIRNQIPGDFVECGVWKGGSCMLIALTLLKEKISSRGIWLYDTFEGMTKPGDQDGEAEKKEWQEKSTGIDSSTWCYAGEDEVKQYVLSTGYPSDQFNFIKGKVEDTIPDSMPDQIALLRLDTDWYASTKHELIHLYPILQSGGVLIIDDYGAWKGARHATDEYFENKVLLQRIDWTGRMLVK